MEKADDWRGQNFYQKKNTCNLKNKTKNCMPIQDLVNKLSKCEKEYLPTC